MRSPLGVALELDLDAQRTFLGRLLPYLSDHGARTAEELKGAGLSLFELPLNGEEVEDLLELARRQDLVRPLTGDNGRVVNTRAAEWGVTDRGREVRPPTGLTLKDSRTYVIRVTPLGSKMTGVVQALLGLLPVAALLKISTDDAVGKGALVAGGVLALVLLAVLYFGFKGDARLRRAALAWARYRQVWPRSYVWQVNSLRPWLGVAGLLLYFAPFLLVFTVHVGCPRGVAYAAFLLGLAAIFVLITRRRQGKRERRESPVEPEPAPAPEPGLRVRDEHRGADGFGSGDLELLVRHVPYLHYDAQDGYRAVTAATMTDSPENQLAQAVGTVIANRDSDPPLSLSTLTEYPSGFSFQAGDHLASGKEPLAEALALQAREDSYPHATHARVVRRDGRIWLEYWLWYYDNPKTFLGKGRHQGDWEMVIVELGEDEQPRSVTCSQHNGGEVRGWGQIEPQDGHPVIYVAPFSHANYFEPRTVFYFPGADHPTATGPYQRPTVVPFGDWQEWRGRWGASRGPFGGRFNIGGTSPDAPIAQEPRWDRPDRFHAAGVRRKPVAWLFRQLWRIGTATFPLAPRLRWAKIENGQLNIDFELRPQGLHRGSHLLLSVHQDGGVEPMLKSEVLRSAPERGRHRIALDGDLQACVVYASVFNGLGQRSDPVRIVASAG